ncbi:MAG: ISAzo13 family transposase [Xenococcaceae cyanobacterium MO_234.B1]|nr:ISAzo13 family transposase [Xenococcaceae cyanobacterium MO_234.B1]
MELTGELKALFIETAQKLKGHERRIFMAKVVSLLGPGGQRQAESEFGWNRGTIRKGRKELSSGLRCADAFSCRGRHKVEKRLPNLLEDIKSIVDSQSQIDPSFKTQRLYTRLSAAEVRRQLIKQKQYREASLRAEKTIGRRLNQLGYYPARIAKTKPLKTIPQTNAIMKQVSEINQEADFEETTLRISLDAKARVKLGEFDRGGKSRVKTFANDHDFSKDSLVPFGILLPKLAEFFLFFSASRFTSDFIVDCLEQWWEKVSNRFVHIQTLVINQDNGPENHSRRTQFLKRIVEFVQKYHLNIRLAYYPPYYSKYNPIERTWAVLENHWNGSLLDEVETVLNFAQTMTWKGKHPTVNLIEQTYEKGVRLKPKEMERFEAQVQRLSNQGQEKMPDLGKWFVDISWDSA